MLTKLLNLNSQPQINCFKKEISEFLTPKTRPNRYKSSPQLKKSSNPLLVNDNSKTKFSYKYLSSLEQSSSSKNLLKNANSADHYISVRYSKESCPPEPPRKPLSEVLHTSLNHQILEEIQASYIYLSMACFFARTDVALPGCYVYFKKMYKEELGHADVLIKYLTMRGGVVNLNTIEPPCNQNWEGIQNVLINAIQLETCIRDQLVKLCHSAEKERDFGLADLIQGEFVREQDESINELTRLLVRYSKMTKCGRGCGCGEYLFDRELFRIFSKKEGETVIRGHDIPPNSYI
ncbi:ferritin-like [Agrilus planipennis]|uniref:Ferritin n=1 Tax=Agrilus planipennis TaxID=224129 RepID=A0A1W4X580_AGRPL|nr:ferritin-like [Agrilus planipennis]